MSREQKFTENDLFKPLSIKVHLTVEYPELKEYPEFLELSTEEMYFVYLYKCRGSYLYNQLFSDKDKAGFLFNTEEEKAKQCFVKAFGKKAIIGDSANKYLSLNFPDHVKNAIPVMEKFNPTARMMAKDMAMVAFMNIQKIIHKPIGEDSSSDEKEKYITTVSKAIKEIPNLLTMIEHGHGYKKVKQKELRNTSDNIEDGLIDDVSEEDIDEVGIEEGL